MKKVLFVCSGNTCRSPMAELYFNNCCRRRGIDAAADSAGTGAWPGDEISGCASAVLGRLGIDASQFRSRRFSALMAAEYDLIVAMTPGHLHFVLETVPEAADRSSILTDYSPAAVRGGVPDPFGGSEAEYQAVFDFMKPALDTLAERCRQ